MPSWCARWPCIPHGTWRPIGPHGTRHCSPLEASWSGVSCLSLFATLSGGTRSPSGPLSSSVAVPTRSSLWAGRSHPAAAQSQAEELSIETLQNDFAPGQVEV